MVRINLYAITAALLCTSAYASNFVAYSGGHYSGSSKSIGKCGCSSIPYRGSYKWYAEGQSGRVYNGSGCSGAAHSVLKSDANSEQSSSYGWKSIFIVC
ncbi:hypothetical protein K7432_014793 [Basidiobolus ranarum]|uniref:Lactococcin 972 family bacteriocin n=1 Tax=Basidiobolus ranarum TaxID=34480 RepID=A0ABR2WH28_9FUNG